MATDNNKNKTEEYELDTITNERLIKDHDYDGIRELDNDLPGWWKWLFYITIAFAIVYLVRLFVFNSDDLIQSREYAMEMEGVKTNQPDKTVDDAFELVLLEDDASMAAGKETWDKICAACHLPDGGGLVGPNMTDDYWIHGNTVEDMYKIVTDGVIAKGMLPYKDQLSKKERLEVISYIILKIHGTTPANPKEPQGEKY
ncbi:MAG: hypothetical protein C0595_09105 [Marinilabiliales bacterium]|nr:MAG: hypothetical protein C0595_09105 [Marinilabiliales bacterium]